MSQCHPVRSAYAQEDRFLDLYARALFGGAREVKKMIDYNEDCSEGCFDIEKRDVDGNFTLLQTFAMNHQIEGVLVLLEKQADVHAIDRDGNTALHLSIATMQTCCYTTTHYTGEMCFKPSAYAEAVVKLLVYYKANIHTKNNCGETPLHTAASVGEPEVLRFLLDQDQYTYTDLDKKKSNGLDPLDICVENSRYWQPDKNTTPVLIGLQKLKHKRAVKILHEATLLNNGEIQSQSTKLLPLTLRAIFQPLVIAKNGFCLSLPISGDTENVLKNIVEEHEIVGRAVNSVSTPPRLDKQLGAVHHVCFASEKEDEIVMKWALY